jgi:hypothetical protein
MADTIKFKRGRTNATIASTSIVPEEGEPVYDIYSGKLYVGDGVKTLAQLISNEMYWVRWDKVSLPNSKLAGDIINDKLAGGITNDKLAGDITSDKIGSGEIKEDNLDTGAVTTTKIDYSAVTLDKFDIDHNEYSGVTTIKEYIRSVAGDGVNATSATTATKLAAGVANSSETRPVWFPTSTADNRVVGKPYLCKPYAGGTAVTLNGTSKAASTATIYAPTGQPSSSSNNFFVQWKTSGAAGWQDVTSTSVKWNRSSYADTADKADAIKIGDDYYSATFTNGVLQFDKLT